MNIRLPAFFIACVITLTLVGCSNESNQVKIRKYIASLQHRNPTPLTPIPTITPPKPFKYSATSLRSPFQQEIKLSKIMPDVNRVKEPLETFPLDSLRMVGTLNQNHKEWGLVVAPDGTVHHVKNGAYLGQHFGRIISITKEKIQILEKVLDRWGVWEERKNELTIETEESQH